jgi:hypothetical protein
MKRPRVKTPLRSRGHVRDELFETADAEGKEKGENGRAKLSLFAPASRFLLLHFLPFTLASSLFTLHSSLCLASHSNDSEAKNGLLTLLR